MKAIVITGTTASKKTEVAIELAKRINGEIISADSMQIYKYMDIGTAKPTEKERSEIKHHLIDIKRPDESFSAGEFLRNALRLIDDIRTRGKQAIVVGGTAFYIDALINGLDSVEAVDSKVKQFFDDICDELGSFYLYEWLKLVDEEWAERISPSDCQRIKRGLSFYVDKGVPLSSRFKENRERRDDFALFVLYASREYLEERVRARTRAMVEKGLIEEVKWLIENGYGDAPSLKAIGYKEVVDYLEGRLESIDELVEAIVKDTLSFAKRQITFFRSRFKDARWIDIEREKPLEVILETVSGHLS